MLKKSYWKVVIFLLVVVLALPVLTACDDDDDDEGMETTPAVAKTTESIKTTEAVKSTEPVKIGFVSDWSGPYGLVGPNQSKVIDLVTKQVKDMGGILGGRQIDVITYDAGGEVSQTVAGIKKLVYDDDVVAFAMMGVSATNAVAGMEAANDLGRLGVLHTSLPENLADYPYGVRMPPTTASQIQQYRDLVVNVLKPETVSIIALNIAEGREALNLTKDLIEPEGIEVISEQYVEAGTKDFSPYVTRIKRDNPDVLLTKLDSPGDSIGLMKAAESQGGWGDIKVVFLSMGGYLTWGMDIAQGTYHWNHWIPGLDHPGAKEFEEAFMGEYDKMPGATELYAYNNLWVAVHAIELAGTDDPDEIARAARSGDLQWESPFGLQIFGTDGENNANGVVAQIVDRKPVLVPLE